MLIVNFHQNLVMAKKNLVVNNNFNNKYVKRYSFPFSSSYYTVKRNGKRINTEIHLLNK